MPIISSQWLRWCIQIVCIFFLEQQYKTQRCLAYKEKHQILAFEKLERTLFLDIVAKKERLKPLIDIKIVQLID